MSPNSTLDSDAVIFLSPPVTPPSMPSETCDVCGDRANNTRYGASACLGCTVFFRRSITKHLKYMCLKNKECVIHFSYRSACRYCRFHKCVKVGMKEEAIQRRDVLGPRRSTKSRRSPEVVIIGDQSDTFLQALANYQREQLLEHPIFFAENQVDVAFHKDQALTPSRNRASRPQSNSFLDQGSYILLNSLPSFVHATIANLIPCMISQKNNNIVRYRRRARAHDVDVMLKLCVKQALDWGNRLKPFRRLSWDSKKSVLAEYCLAFLLIDQGFKTAKEADPGFWLLQNGSFMHPDYFFGLQQATINLESMSVKIQLHQNFVTELLNCVAEPFRRLEVDEIECAALKTLLVLKPSCSERAIYSGQEGVLAGIYTKCIDELMEHCKAKSADSSEIRFGEIMLLISSIRCGVKAIYNQTRISDLMNFMNFDKTVREILLT